MLVLKPNVAILDEPDSGLDIDAVKSVAEAINKLMRYWGGSSCNYALCTDPQILVKIRSC